MLLKKAGNSERVDKLFGKNLAYEKIREKLIGITLYYYPDLGEIMQTLIHDSSMNLDLKTLLKNNVDFFVTYMTELNHPNLRTFQFFLSKIDKEDGRYLFEEFVKVQETHEVSFEVNLELYIDNLDEEAIKQKLNGTRQLIQEYDDELLTITCEPETISIPKGTIIVMDEWSLSEREIVSQTIDDNWEEEEWEGEKPYTICPACGKLISHQNDGGNGFCIDCAWEH